MQRLETRIPTSPSRIPAWSTPAQDLYPLDSEFGKYHRPEAILGVHPHQHGTAFERGMWYMLHEVVSDPKIPAKLSGSMASNRVSAHPLNSSSNSVIQEIVYDAHDLQDLCATGKIKPENLSNHAEFWRRVLLYMAQNEDYLLKLHADDPDNSSNLFDIVTGIQTYIQRNAGFTVSMINNNRFDFVRIRNPRNRRFSGINIIGLPADWKESHSSATSLREKETRNLRWKYPHDYSKEQGFYIDFEEEDYYRPIKCTREYSRFGTWLNDCIRTLRSHALIRKPMEIDVASFLDRRPDGNEFSFDEITSIVANGIVFNLHEPYQADYLLKRFELERFFVPYHPALVQFDFMNALDEMTDSATYVSRYSRARFAESAAKFMALDPEVIYDVVPPPSSRDRVTNYVDIPQAHTSTHIKERTSNLIERMQKKDHPPLQSLIPAMYDELDRLSQ